MGIGIFKKIKNGFRKVGSTLRNVAQRVVDKLPTVVNVGRQIIDRVKPIAGLIPGAGGLLDTIDRGLGTVGKAGEIGKSILDKV